jgi:hypothetical protein
MTSQTTRRRSLAELRANRPALTDHAQDAALTLYTGPDETDYTRIVVEGGSDPEGRRKLDLILDAHTAVRSGRAEFAIFEHTDTEGQAHALIVRWSDTGTELGRQVVMRAVD